MDLLKSQFFFSQVQSGYSKRNSNERDISLIPSPVLPQNGRYYTFSTAISRIGQFYLLLVPWNTTWHNVYPINPKAPAEMANIVNIDHNATCLHNHCLRFLLGRLQRPIHTGVLPPEHASGSFCTCQYTRGSVFKFAQFAPGVCSQIFNRLNIVEDFAGWKFFSRGWSIAMKSLVHTEELCSRSVPLGHASGAKSLVCIGLNTQQKLEILMVIQFFFWRGGG